MDNTRSKQKYVSTYAAQMYFIVLNNGFVNSKTINYFRWHSIDNMVNKSIREKISWTYDSIYIKFKTRTNTRKVIILAGEVCGSINETSECGMFPGGGHSAS